jgi:hypothetical protein
VTENNVEGCVCVCQIMFYACIVFLKLYLSSDYLWFVDFCLLVYQPSTTVHVSLILLHVM